MFNPFLAKTIEPKGFIENKDRFMVTQYTEKELDGNADFTFIVSYSNGLTSVLTASIGQPHAGDMVLYKTGELGTLIQTVMGPVTFNRKTKDLALVVTSISTGLFNAYKMRKAIENHPANKPLSEQTLDALASEDMTRTPEYVFQLKEDGRARIVFVLKEPPFTKELRTPFDTNPIKEMTDPDKYYFTHLSALIRSWGHTVRPEELTERIGKTLRIYDGYSMNFVFRPNIKEIQ